MSDQTILDNLNFGGAAADTVQGVETGIKIGSSVGAAAGSVFPPLAPVLALAGTYYGAVAGAVIGFMYGLFSADPAVTRRKAAELAAQIAWYNKILNNMFATWPPTARDVFVQTPMYQRLVSLARTPEKYNDPLGYINDPEIMNTLRERIRLATIDAAHPQGITFGDAAIKAQVADRLAGRASAVESGLKTGLLSPRPMSLAEKIAIAAASVALTGGAIYGVLRWIEVKKNQKKGIRS